MEEPLTKKAKKKAKKEQLKNVELLAEKQTYFGDEQTGDADTWWLKAKIPSGANRIRLDYHPIGKKDERVSQVYPNVQHRQVDGWVGLRVTGLASTADTGYNFFAYENDESDSFGECIRSKRKADAPAPAPPPPPPPRGEAAPAPAPAPLLQLPPTPPMPSIDQLIEDTRRWFRVEEGEDSVNRTRDKGARFERFMAWFMMFVWNRENGGFESVTCTGGSHDRGRDIVCVPMNRMGHGSRRDHVIVNCKNYKSNYSPDLVYTMYGRLVSSGFDSTGEECYSTAIAAVHPQFTQSTPLVGDLIEEFNRVSPGRRLHYLEWCGSGNVHGISAKLKIKLRGDDGLKQHFHYCYLEEFKLDENGCPKQFNINSYAALLARQANNNAAQAN